MDSLFAAARASLEHHAVSAEPHVKYAFWRGVCWVLTQLLDALAGLFGAFRDSFVATFGSDFWAWVTTGAQFVVLMTVLNYVRRFCSFSWFWLGPMLHCGWQALECVLSMLNYMAARPRLIEYNGIRGVVPPLRGPAGARPFDNKAVSAML